MSALKVIAVLLAGCGNLQGFGGDVPPIVTVRAKLEFPMPASVTSPRVALVWGMQWLPEAFCILPGENAGADALKTAGCRDSFGFVPLRVEANAPIVTEGDNLTATIELTNVPAADALVGDLTARVAYASLILYDDRDGDGTLTIARPDRIQTGDMMGPPDPTPTTQKDVVVAASFQSMLSRDARLAYREGAFVQTAFYPRVGCGDPPPAFSILEASGFDSMALAEAAAGQLPHEANAGACVETTPDQRDVRLLNAFASEVAETACTERNADSTVRYLEPPVDQPDTDLRTAACVHVPSFGGPSTQIEFLVSGKSTDACKAVNHFILEGCREGPDCGTPDWDHSQAPPSWWPCPLQ